MRSVRCLNSRYELICAIRNPLNGTLNYGFVLHSSQQKPGRCLPLLTTANYLRSKHKHPSVSPIGSSISLDCRFMPTTKSLFHRDTLSRKRVSTLHHQVRSSAPRPWHLAYIAVGPPSILSSSHSSQHLISSFSSLYLFISHKFLFAFRISSFSFSQISNLKKVKMKFTIFAILSIATR